MINLNNELWYELYQKAMKNSLQSMMLTKYTKEQINKMDTRMTFVKSKNGKNKNSELYKEFITNMAKVKEIVINDEVELMFLNLSKNYKICSEKLKKEHSIDAISSKNF